MGLKGAQYSFIIHMCHIGATYPRKPTINSWRFCYFLHLEIKENIRSKKETIDILKQQVCDFIDVTSGIVEHCFTARLLTFAFS